MIKNKVWLVVIVAALLMASGTVLAQTATKNKSFSSTKKVVQPAPPKHGSSFRERLAQRKAERQIVLAKEDIQRLRDRCVDVQTKVRVLSVQTATITNNHLDVYNKIDAKLWVMVGQIKLAGKDTFTLEKYRSNYVSQVAAFKATATYYKQALDDLVLEKCQADPIGFQALVETSRLYYATLQTQVADIRTYVVNKVKPSLADYSNQLQTTLDSSRQ